MSVLKSVGKIKVVLKRIGNDNLQKTANFLDCLVRFFDTSNYFAPVNISFADNILTLSGPIPEIGKSYNNSNEEPDATNVVVLQHSPECPISNLTENDAEQIPQDVISKGIGIGVAIVLESSDNKILMTRRASHLRTFPNAWVPPGGHLEENETLIDAGLRELKEETGILLNPETASIKILCLWESVYPLLLGIDLPKRHHIVVYLHAVVNRPWKDIHSEIKLDPGEVQACTWLNEEVVGKLLTTNEKDDLGLHEMFKIEDNGLLVACGLDLSTMFHHLLWKKGKVYSGSQLALMKWMNVATRRSLITSKI